MKPIGIMSEDALKRALVRAIVLEYQNAKRNGRMSWGYDAPPSMYVARKNRIRLAKRYAQKYAPVSILLFQRRLPAGTEWEAIGALVSNPIYDWVDGVWSHIGCTVPEGHCREADNA